MKTYSLLYVGLIMSIIMVLTISTLTMKSSYAETIRSSLDDSIVYSVKMLQRDHDLVEYDSHGKAIDLPKGYSTSAIVWDNWDIDDQTDAVAKFKNDFVKYLTGNLNARISSVDVDIYGVDVTVGALSVKVTATFEYPSGREDTVETYKTVILNKEIK